MSSTCENRVWLALSGGGLRSCAFATGVISSLTPQDGHVEHVASVSGGGYAGSSHMISMMHAYRSDLGIKATERKSNMFCLYNYCIYSIVLGVLCIANSRIPHLSLAFSRLFHSWNGKDTVVDNDALLGPVPVLAQYSIVFSCIVLICFLVSLIKDVAAWFNVSTLKTGNPEYFQPQQRNPFWAEKWKNRVKQNFGYVVSLDSWFVPDLDSEGKEKKLWNPLLLYVGQIIVTTCDTFWLIVCFVVFPLMFFCITLYPFAMMIVILSLHFPMEYFSWTYTTYVRCDREFPMWSRVLDDTHVEVASASPLVFAVPFCVLSGLMTMNLLRVSLEPNRTQVKNELNSFREGLKTGMVLLLIGIGWYLACFRTQNLWCGGLSRMEVVVEGFIAIGICLAGASLTRFGGLVFGSVVSSTFAYLVLCFLGPTKTGEWIAGEGSLVHTPSLGPILRFVQASCREGFPYMLLVCGVIVFSFPKLANSKRMIMHRFYRYCLSRSYLPCKEDVPVNVLARVGYFADRFFMDVLRCPFSFRTGEIFPFDHTTFSEMQAFRTFMEAHKEVVPFMEFQLSVQLWTEVFEDRNGDQVNDALFGDQVTAKSVFTANAEGFSRFNRKKGQHHNVVGSHRNLENHETSTAFTREDAPDMEILVAVAVSAAAVGATAGAESNSTPNAMVSFLGGGCARWIRHDPKLDGIEFDILLSVVMACLGSVMMFAGAHCTVSGHALGRDPCENSSLFALGASFLILLFLILMFVLVLGIPQCANRLYSTGLTSSPLFQELFSVLSISYFGGHSHEMGFRSVKSPNPLKFLASDGGFVENMALLPLLLRAKNFTDKAEKDEKKKFNEALSIVVADGGELSTGELVTLMPAISYARDWLGLTCRVMGGYKHLMDFASLSSLRKLTRDQLLLMQLMCEDKFTEEQALSLYLGDLQIDPIVVAVPAPEEINDVKNRKAHFKSTRIASLTDSQVGLHLAQVRQVVEHQKTGCLHLQFSSAKEGVFNVFLLRARQDENSNAPPPLFGFWSSPHKVVRITRCIIVVAVFAVVFTMYGLLLDFLTMTFAKLCNPYPGLDSARAVRYYFGVMVSVALFLGRLLRIGALPATTSNAVELLAPAGMQFVASYIVSLPFVTADQKCDVWGIPPLFPVRSSVNELDCNYWDLYLVYLVFGVLVGLLLGCNVGGSFQGMIGTFPNHDTTVMQPTSDSAVFERYAEAGRRAIQEFRIAKKGFKAE